MNEHRALLQQQTRTSQQITRASLDAETLADMLLERVEAEQAQLGALLDAAAPAEFRYNAALATQVKSKHEQAERIEDRIENLIDRQASRLQQTRAQQPGLLALPSTKARWQQQVQQQQSTLQRLQGRLEIVREITDGVGTNGPRLEELATRRLRNLEPGLACGWDELQEELRRHRAVQRMNGPRHQSLVAGNGSGTSNILSIDNRP
jgi:hypothetical protein